MNVITRFSFSIAALMLIAFNTCAQDLRVSAQQLGVLIQETAPISAISYYSGQVLNAQVTTLPGQSNSIRSPMNVRQTVFFQPNGTSIDKGEQFVALSGPEVHHYYSEYQLRKTLYKQSKLLYENSKILFSKKVLSEQSWLEVSKEHILVKLAFDEFTHFFDLMHSFDEKTDTLILRSPVSGVLTYQNVDNLSVEQQIASIVPLDSVRLSANFPLSQDQSPSYIQYGKCRPAVAFVEKVANGFLSRLWTEPLAQDCSFIYNEIVSVSPQYTLNGFLINKSSVMTLDGQYYIFVKEKDIYTAVAIELISSDEHQYVVTSKVAIADKLVLTTSVSAAQGILLGLGE